MSAPEKVFAPSFDLLGLHHEECERPDVGLRPHHHTERDVPPIGRLHWDSYVDFRNQRIYTRLVQMSSGAVAWYRVTKIVGVE